MSGSPYDTNELHIQGKLPDGSYSNIRKGLTGPFLLYNRETRRHDDVGLTFAITDKIYKSAWGRSYPCWRIEVVRDGRRYAITTSRAWNTMTLFLDKTEERGVASRRLVQESEERI